MGLNFLHDGGSHFFRFSLRGAMRGASEVSGSPGSGDGEAGRDEHDARVRANARATTRRAWFTHHDASDVSAAASERTGKRPDTYRVPSVKLATESYRTVQRPFAFGALGFTECRKWPGKGMHGEVMGKLYANIFVYFSVLSRRLESVPEFQRSGDEGFDFSTRRARTFGPERKAQGASPGSRRFAMGVESYRTHSVLRSKYDRHDLRKSRRAEVKFVIGLLAFVFLTVAWTSLLPSHALPGARRGDFRPEATRSAHDVHAGTRPRSSLPEPAGKHGDQFHAFGHRAHSKLGGSNAPVSPASSGRRLILASHGRLMWLDVDTHATEINHEGRGVY